MLMHDRSVLVLQQVQEVCQLVAVRGARLTAAAIAGMLRHLGRDDRSGPDAPRNVVAVEGAVMRKCASFNPRTVVVVRLHKIPISLREPCENGAESTCQAVLLECTVNVNVNGWPCQGIDPGVMLGHVCTDRVCPSLVAGDLT